MSNFLLVLGTPGVGKSELSRHLGKRLGLDAIELGRVVREKKLYKRFDPRTRSYEIDERRVRDYLVNGIGEKDVVIATHSLGRAFQPRRVRLAIVLRLDPVILYRRLRA